LNTHALKSSVSVERRKSFAFNLVVNLYKNLGRDSPIFRN
jgi:hypothetical protein